jgi:hypothetical protein
MPETDLGVVSVDWEDYGKSSRRRIAAPRGAVQRLA